MKKHIDCEPLKEILVWEHCAYCYAKLLKEDIIGYGEYPQGRIGHNPHGKTIVYECPKCFEKSFCHYCLSLDL